MAFTPTTRYLLNRIMAIAELEPEEKEGLLKELFIRQLTFSDLSASRMAELAAIRDALSEALSIYEEMLKFPDQFMCKVCLSPLHPGHKGH